MPPSRSSHVPSKLGPAALAGFARWREAMRWQRAVDRALRPLGLTHTQLLVLSAAESTIRQAKDAVAQVTIAKEAGLDSVTTSTVLRTLENRGLADRGAASVDRRRSRVILTPQGERALLAAAPLVEEAAKAPRASGPGGAKGSPRRR